MGQKAPSAKRCIKTKVASRALRPLVSVRKHPAPKGALRPVSIFVAVLAAYFGQKAPIAKRCIKTCADLCLLRRRCLFCQKAPSAKRCIKTRRSDSLLEIRTLRSESTQRQKVH